MKYIGYMYGRASLEASALIVGKVGTPNPIADRRTNYLPCNKLKIGDSLRINKAEVKNKEQLKVVKECVKRYNGYADCLRIVETGTQLEIVRIK